MCLHACISSSSGVHGMSVAGKRTSPGGWYGPASFHDGVRLCSVPASPSSSCRALGVAVWSMAGSTGGCSSLVRCDRVADEGNVAETGDDGGRVHGPLPRFSSSLERFA